MCEGELDFLPVPKPKIEGSDRGKFDLEDRGCKEGTRQCQTRIRLRGLTFESKFLKVMSVFSQEVADINRVEIQTQDEFPHVRSCNGSELQL